MQHRKLTNSTNCKAKVTAAVIARSIIGHGTDLVPSTIPTVYMPNMHFNIILPSYLPSGGTFPEYSHKQYCDLIVELIRFFHSVEEER